MRHVFERNRARGTGLFTRRVIAAVATAAMLAGVGSSLLRQRRRKMPREPWNNKSSSRYCKNLGKRIHSRWNKI